MKACGAVRDSLVLVTLCVKLMTSGASFAGRVPTKVRRISCQPGWNARQPATRAGIDGSRPWLSAPRTPSPRTQRLNQPGSADERISEVE